MHMYNPPEFVCPGHISGWQKVDPSAKIISSVNGPHRWHAHILHLQKMLHWRHCLDQWNASCYLTLMHRFDSPSKLSSSHHTALLLSWCSSGVQSYCKKNSFDDELKSIYINTLPRLEWQNMINQSAWAAETQHSSDCQFHLAVWHHLS